MYYQEDPNYQKGAAAAAGAVGAATQGIDAVLGATGNISSSAQKIGQLADQSAKLAGSATDDINAIRNQQGKLDAYIGALTGKGQQLTDAAQIVKGNADKIGSYEKPVADIAGEIRDNAPTYKALGGRIETTAGNLDPYIAALTGQGSTLFSEGTGRVGSANGVTDIGLGLLNMDGSSSPLAAEFLRLYGMVDPEQYAAREQSAIRGQLESQMEQQRRQVARSGGSVTGGNALSLGKQFRQAMAEAVVGAAQKGRQLGLDTKVGYMKTLSDMANQFLATGDQMFGTGVAAQKAGADATNAAGDLEAKKASVLKEAASVYGLGDDALKTSASLYGDAAAIVAATNKGYELFGGMTKDAASLDSAAAGLVKDQAEISKTVVSAILSQAGALNDAAKTEQSSSSSWATYIDTINKAYGTLVNAKNAEAQFYENILRTGVNEPKVKFREDLTK